MNRRSVEYIYLDRDRDEMLSLRMAASRLHVNFRTLRTAISSGELPAYQITAKNYRVIWGEVADWVRSKRTSVPNARNPVPTSPPEVREPAMEEYEKHPQSSVSDGRAGENTASTVGPPSDAPAAEREKPGETGKPNLASK